MGWEQALRNPTQLALEICSRDLLWEYEPTVHWALMIKVHQRELEHSGGPRRLLHVEDRHALSDLLRPNTEATV